MVVRSVISSVQTVSRFMCFRVIEMIAVASVRGSVRISCDSWMQKSVKNSAYLRKFAADCCGGFTADLSS